MSALHIAAWLLTATGFYLAGRYGYRRFRDWLENERTRQEFAELTFDLYRDDDLRARFRELNRELGGSTDLSTAGRGSPGRARHTYRGERHGVPEAHSHSSWPPREAETRQAGPARTHRHRHHRGGDDLMNAPIPEPGPAERIRAYLDADAGSNSFGRLMPYELPKGAPRSLTRADLVKVLDQLDSARHRHRAYPDAANPNAYCLNCLTRRKEVGSNFPEYVKWPCPDAVALGVAKEVNP